MRKSIVIMNLALSVSLLTVTPPLKSPVNVAVEDKNITKDDKKKSYEVNIVYEEIVSKPKVEIEEEQVVQQEVHNNYSRGGELPKKSINFNPNDVSIPSNVSVDQINELLKDTGLKGLGSTYVEVERTYGVNALFLISVTALESYWGQSDLAKQRNNLSGYYVNGKPKYFRNKAECVLETGRLLGEDYIKESGKYHKGKSIKAININYCEVNTWTDKVITIGKQLKKK